VRLQGRGYGKRFTPAWCLNLALRLAIAAVFLWAARDKLVHPDRFADIVHDYNLLPLALVNVFAVCLPWVETAVAICLLLGIWVPSVALLATGMTVMFMAAISAALAQAHHLNCGCFTTSPEGEGEAWGLLWRDAALLVACAWLFWRSWRGGKVSPETIREADTGESGD
jgi:uncharacterized membrane protein YphA (DoxX/SURF4 family)